MSTHSHDGYSKHIGFCTWFLALQSYAAGRYGCAAYLNFDLRALAYSFLGVAVLDVDVTFGHLGSARYMCAGNMGSKQAGERAGKPY